ncbi:HNH endonuclease signature motif containing protein [Nocardioides massiliensis]|uniref:HNH nuclease domain-containing protein n=1 Tax=Nocardioides massiliensis TaxID=1325935 RepID=A0ABT9NSM6_9ACTN|nr:HNH endonuclease signature motif containing protein [Nocardioides massiliensis]MDP9823184.1 hypothetical protein [Nocardioides massiliensis]
MDRRGEFDEAHEAADAREPRPMVSAERPTPAFERRRDPGTVGGVVHDGSMDQIGEFDEAREPVDEGGQLPPACPEWLLADLAAEARGERPEVVPPHVEEELTFTARNELGALRAVEVLAVVEQRRLLMRRWESDQVLLAVRLAESYETMPGVRTADNTDRDRPNRIVVAGEGAPSVHEHAPLELAAALGMSPDSGIVLMSHSLELRYRLPKLWERLEAGEVEAWRARQVAGQTLKLDLAIVTKVDELLASTRRAINKATALELITEALLALDPEEAARLEAEKSDGRGMFVLPPLPGDSPAFTEVHARLDTPDAEALEAMVEKVAGILAAQLTAEGRDPEPWQHHRATALGMLADPHAAAELLDTATTTPTRAGRLYVHIEFGDLAKRVNTETSTDHGARAERYGAMTLDLVEQWLRRRDIKVTPVINMDAEDAVDGHDPPPRMREQVILRDAHCQAPHCTRPARACDLDHVEPYVPPDEGGPPGQTSPANLQVLCRRHHRMKTHAEGRFRALARAG